MVKNWFLEQYGPMQTHIPPVMELLDPRLYFSAAVIGQNLRIEGTTADNVIRVTQYTDRFKVQMDGRSTIFPRAGIKRVVVYGNDGDDRIDLRRISSRAMVKGNEGDDTIFGGKGNDQLYGDEDNDLIKGGTGNDTLEGGDDEDTLFGNAGDDSFHTRDSFGSDYADGGAGNDRAKIDPGGIFYESDEVDNVEDIA